MVLQEEDEEEEREIAMANVQRCFLVRNAKRFAFACAI